jgi:hypothetical protein
MQDGHMNRPGFETLARHPSLTAEEKEQLRLLMSTAVFQRAMMLVYEHVAMTALVHVARGEPADVVSPNVVFGQLWEMCNGE